MAHPAMSATRRTTTHPARTAGSTRPGGSANKLFTKFAHSVSHVAGMPCTFLVAVAIVLIWAVTGPVFGYSDTWQLIINTGTTIVTFLMVFLIQSTQNRDTLALQLKLSELIIAVKGAKNSTATIEDLSEEELEQLHKELSDRMQLTRAAMSDRKRTNDDDS
jgi:low affinity Fe/Cu permease